MRVYYPTTWRSDEQRFYFLVSASLILSLALHFCFFLALKRIPLMPPGTVTIHLPEKSVRLEFIDSPERILEPLEEPRDTNLISDRASLAQDVIPDKTEATDLPRSVGTVKEKSIRKIPEGRPSEIREPLREAKMAAAEGVSPEGVHLSKYFKEKRDLGQELVILGRESPYLFKGKDEYLAPESEIPEGKTRILKQVAYNVRSHAVGEYLARIHPRVANLWHLNVMSHTFYPRSERTSVFFKIMPDGSLGKIVLGEHQGPEIEMIYSLNAIEYAQPFEPLTEGILEYIKDDGLWLEFNFIYH